MTTSMTDGAMSLERMTPEHVLDVRFPERELGYDKQRVDSFLVAVAEELRQLSREIATANEKVDKPQLGAGREIGDLLQRAHDLAERIKAEAESEAAVLRHSAHGTAVRTQRESEELLKRARREAEDLVREARAEAQHARETAAHLHRLAEAKATVLQREAYRDARAIRDDAKTVAEKLIATAKGRMVEEAQQLENRIRRLRDAELKLRRRVHLLVTELGQLEGRTDIRREEPEVLQLSGSGDS